MTVHYLWMGSVGPIKYDDSRDIKDPGGHLPAGTKEGAIVSTGQIVLSDSPSGLTQVVRQQDLTSGVDQSESFAYFMEMING